MRLPSLALFAISACAGPPPRAPSASAPPLHTPTPADFPAADRSLVGIAPLATAGTWHRGDSVLYGLSLHGPSSAKRWQLQLTVVDPELQRVRADHSGSEPDVQALQAKAEVNGKPELVQLTSKRMLVELRVTDERGQQIARSQVRAPRDLLETGLEPACRATATAASPASGSGAAAARADPTRRQIEAMLCLVALLDVVQNDATLAAILWDVVDKPSLWSVVWNLGAKTALAPAFDRVTLVAWPTHLPASGSLWSLPVTLTVNGTAALECQIAVGNPQPPFALCGGVFELLARSPTEPERWFAMTLLAARLGSE